MRDRAAMRRTTCRECGRSVPFYLCGRGQHYGRMVLRRHGTVPGGRITCPGTGDPVVGGEVIRPDLLKWIGPRIWEEADF
jgi:hypothetical protein